MYCARSIHKDGYRYEIVGTPEPVTLDLLEANELEEHLDDICKRNGIQYLNDHKSLTPIRELSKDGNIIHEGHNRHEAVLRIAESLIKRNRAILSLDKIKPMAWEWNEEHCMPPLDLREFDRQWNDAMAFIAKKETDSLVTVGNNQLQQAASDPQCGRRYDRITIRKNGLPCGGDNENIHLQNFKGYRNNCVL